MTGRLGAIAAAAAACSLVLMAGCDNEEPGSPGSPTTPTLPTAPPSSPSDNANAQAPRVDQPLDATAFVADPCKSLTDAQRNDFALQEGKQDPDTTIPGEVCAWDNDAAQVSVDVTYQPELTNGLSHLYAQHESGQWSVWEPTEVDGYPAVHVGDVDVDKMGSCSIAVGLSDSLFFRTTVRGNEGDNSCAAARNVASAVVGNIKSGGA